MSEAGCEADINAEIINFRKLMSAIRERTDLNQAG